jgi:hypothetical protein
VFVVIASCYDQTAQALVDRWKDQDAHLLTCKDLSVGGWRHLLTNPHDGTAVIGGQVVDVHQIRGVLIRMPCVFEQELTHIIAPDRAYVAAEMNAFLISWLSTLKCPVLNQPTPTYLLGPAWRSQQWVYAAAQLGIRVRPILQQISLTIECLPPPDQDGIAVTVVGDRCIGLVDPALATQAKRLARAANVDLLMARFSGSDGGSDFLDASLWLDLSSSAIADAILEHLQERRSVHSLPVYS